MPSPFKRRPPRQLEDVEWRDWAPVDRATLTFVVHEGRILLIRKKRGLGAGKVNGPGGRLEPGEDALACAIREVQEELCVTPQGLRERGTLRFQFHDGYSIFVTVFLASAYEGRATETEEAIPLWTPIDAIPYEEMWVDDILWIPPMLEGRTFDGRFLFEGDVMLGHAIEFGAG